MSKTTKLRVEGMSCDNCQRHAKNALEDLEGVIRAEVSLEAKEAVVEHEDSVTAQQLIEAVTEEGYPASLLEQNAPS